MANQASTPSTTARSRASTVVLDSSDRGTPAPGYPQLTMTPSRSTPATSVRDGDSGGEARPYPANDNNKFTPFQSLMETEITLEFGKDLKQSKILHEEMLRCHSTSARVLFDKAKPMRERYSQADQMRKDLKSIVSARASDENFDDRAASKKALLLIVHIYEHFPFKVHRESAHPVVNEAISDQVKKGNVTSTQTKNQIQKDIKGMDVQTQMHFLDADGILAVAQRLSTHLKIAKNVENRAAISNPIKAAAQGRYLFPDVELRVVRSLMQWMYCGGGLSYEDAEHLYMLHSLAIRLGITALAEQCLCTLSSDAEGDIQDALSRGLSLQKVLGFGTDAEPDNATQAKPTETSTQVIFRHVLRDPKPPERLISLVVTTLAEHLDPDLWASIVGMMNHAISIRLIQTMVDRKQVKDEELDKLRREQQSAIIKKEPVLFAQNGKMEHN